jgi:hypothetical protein
LRAIVGLVYSRKTGSPAPGEPGDAVHTSRGAINDRAMGRCRVFHPSSTVIKALGLVVLALVLCCGIALAAVGCGEETAATTTTAATAAPTTAAPAPPTTAPAAPPDSAAGAPPDSAAGSPGTTVPLVAGEPIDPADLLGKWYCEANGVTQEFFADGTFTGTDSNGNVTPFAYTLNGSMMTMVMGSAGGPGLQIALTLEGDTLTMADGMQTLVFTRVQ